MPRLSRRNTGLVIVLAIAVLVIAWFDGGYREIRPIEQVVAVPQGAR